MKNKKGSSTVFLAFIIAAVTGVTALFIYAGRQIAYTSISESVMSLSMRSILSEFNMALKDKYGLMAFERNGMAAALEINDYIDYTFNNENPVKEIKVDFGGYELSDISQLKQQILEYMKFQAASEVFTGNNVSFERIEYADRTLRNRAVIKTLPSQPFAEEGKGFLDKLELWKEQIDSMENIFESTTETFIIDQYIVDHFKNAAGGHADDITFFEHEVEYIISGDFSNEKNRKNVETGLKVLRTALNAAHIYSDPEKLSKTLTAAEILTPSSAPATQTVLIATWAAAEADNDVKLLLKGKPVQLIKDNSAWATDLDSVINNLTEEYIDTGNQKGLYYRDYMMIFLHFQEENIKLARVADLIQINMKGNYDRDFLMKTAKCGLKVNTKIYGKEYEYETCY